jgi:hypothetical protein
VLVPQGRRLIHKNSHVAGMYSRLIRIKKNYVFFIFIYSKIIGRMHKNEALTLKRKREIEALALEKKVSICMHRGLTFLIQSTATTLQHEANVTKKKKFFQTMSNNNLY